ncbi:transaldolase, partial [bacterium]|nr:transaldolase [bacterium]
LIDGSLEKLINEGKIRGVTSNPSIFQKAISSSKDYDIELKPTAWSGLNAETIFWRLAIADIRQTADLLTLIYEKTGKKDGFVSLEVNPKLAHDTEGTIQQAVALWKHVNRPNLMVKIPATKAGLPAIRAAIAQGVNVNVTLIFSLMRYAEVIDAFITGLEDRVLAGKPIDSIASVASFFVSRVDTKVDALLLQLQSDGKISAEDVKAMAGKTAIAQVRMAYTIFEKQFGSARFQSLKTKDAQYQRPLWASTSTKNKAYRDVIYVEELIGDHTVNTVPPQTLAAFADHGKAHLTLSNDLDGARSTLERVETLGISMDSVTQELEDEGVQAFATAFDGLIQSIEAKRAKNVTQLGPLQKPLQARISEFEHIHAVDRLYAIDPSLWTTNPEGQKEIRNREDWLNLPWTSVAAIPEIMRLR